MNKFRTLLVWGLLLAATHVMGYTISVSPVEIEAGQSTNLIINLNNTETNLTAYQMKLFLPTGVTVQKKSNGKYAYTSNADRLDPDLFTVTVKDAVDGSVLIAVFSPDKDVITGTSGELIRLPIEVASTVTTSLQGSLKEIEFTDVNNQAYNISDVNFTLTMDGETSPNITFTDSNVKAICVSATTNWDTNHDGELSEAEAAAVTDLGEVFKENTEITSFDELQYFTGLTSICDDAFWGCSGLTSITIPDRVKTIGERALVNCKGLTSITIPQSVEYIGTGISSCSGLTSIIVDEENSVYDSRNNCNAIIKTEANELIAGCKTTFIPDNITSIAKFAFMHCTGLTSIAIPNSVTSIGMQSFYGCNSLKTITLPGGVNLGNQVFYLCDNLENIYISDIAAWCSSDKIDWIVARDSYPGYNLYVNDVLVNELVFPDLVTSIGEEAFMYCGSINSVVIPNCVSEIKSWAFYECKNLASVTIPNTVTYIGIQTFEGCCSLTSITIPESVTSIGIKAFAECSSLTDVWCYAEDLPTTESDAFNNSPIASATLHVPAASLEAYRTTAPWSGFGTIVPIEEAGIEVTDISSAEELIAFATRVNEGHTNINANLTADIDLDGYAYTPIGTEENPFCGTFDGQGHVISNLTIDTDNNNQGLVGAASGGAVVRNVTLDNTCVISGDSYVAGIVGIAYNTGTLTIENCGNEASVVAAGVNAAGILGCAWAQATTVVITNCYNAGTISADGESAGISGWLGSNATVTNCYNIGQVTGLDEDNTFARYESDATFQNCYETIGSQVTPIVSDQVASGELCWLLNGESSENPNWFQTLGEDSYPVPFNTHGIVYAQEGGYTNTPIEVTDISQLDNAIYIVPFEARAGETMTLSVKMKNSVPMESFGFDLVLPEGITVATDEDGFPLAELSTERTTARKTDVFSANFKPDGSLNVQAYSNNKYTISGNDGEVALITINISSTLEAGDYPIILKNIAMGDASATSYRVESVTSKLTVPSYILGDANGDGYVDVADHTAISHWILEQPDASFNFKAADANCDGYVDVADHTAVSHIIIDSSALPTNAAPRPKKLEQIIEPE